MCGIIGYLGKESFLPFVLNGLRLLMNRGYDSVGVSSVVDNQLKTVKHASTHTSDSLDILEKEMINHL